jgi:DNA replication protein DnaC
VIAVEKARQQLLDLGLSQAASILDSRLEAASQKDLTYADFLTDLLDAELAARRERYITARTRLAHLPFHKTLDQFDFSFQPSIDERQVRELATLTFVQEASNIILLGPPGVGKTHLAVALGIEAIRQGVGVYFVTAHTLVEDLKRAYADNRLDRRMRVYIAPKVLIIDEVGYRPFDSVGAAMLFQLVSARYERGAIILTSNKGFGESISPVTAAAIGEVINMTPEEWGNMIFYSTTGLPMTTHMWTKRLYMYSKKIGVKVTPYSLRHTFAIMFLRNGGNQFALKYEMGHSTMAMTSRYVKLAQMDIENQHRIASPVIKLVRRSIRPGKRGSTKKS